MRQDFDNNLSLLFFITFSPSVDTLLDEQARSKKNPISPLRNRVFHSFPKWPPLVQVAGMEKSYLMDVIGNRGNYTRFSD
jgi:hypothetical protein